jgi:hypothetical protein
MTKYTTRTSASQQQKTTRRRKAYDWEQGPAFQSSFDRFDNILRQQIWSASVPYPAKVIALAYIFGEDPKDIKTRMTKEVYLQNVAIARALNEGVN